MKKVAIFNDTSDDRGHYGCKVVMANLHSHLRQHRMETSFSLPMQLDWRSERHNLPSRGSIDAIIVNGEGSMHSSAVRTRARALAELGSFASEFYGVPAFVVNATFHNNDADFYQKLSKFSGIYVRDTASKREAEKFGVVCEVVPDLSMSRPLSTTSQRKGVGVTDSVIESDDIALRKFARSSAFDFRLMVEPKKVSLARGRILRPKYLQRKWNSWRDGRFPRFATTSDFMDWIASKELIVTGRYHTVSLCLLTRTPFIYLESNTPKITWLVQDAGIDQARKIEKLSEQLKETDIKRLDYTAAESNNLDNFLTHSSVSASAMFEEIARRI